MNPAMPAKSVVRLERVIPAPPDQVYRAQLEPALLRRWLAPGELQVTRVEVDERVGGHFRVWQGTVDGDVGGFECELGELVAGRRDHVPLGVRRSTEDRGTLLRFAPDRHAG